MKRNIRILALRSALLVFAGVSLSACNSNSNGPKVAQPAPVTSTKHYQLKGKVVSVDKRAKMLNVDGEEIPGFMSAMTMPYTVKPESELDKLSAGDSITADVVVQDSSAWLENIHVTGHSNSAPPK